MRIIYVVLICVLCTSAAAMAEPVRMEADGLGRYDPQRQLLIVEGRVTLWFEGLEISANTLQWDMQKDTLLFQESVLIIEDDLELESDAFLYNRRDGTGQITKAFTRITADAIEGPVFVLGESIRLTEDAYIVDQGRITTCELDRPHYHVAARSIEVYPEDRLIIRGVVYYEGRIPLFYWPYVAIPLRSDIQQNQLALPRVGYSTEEGWFLKNTYGYYFGPGAFGTLFLDFFTRQGTGIGFRHNYLFAGLGLVSLYAQPADEHWRLRWEHDWQLGDWYGSLAHTTRQDALTSGLRLQQESRGTLYYRGSALRLDAEASFRSTSGTTESQQFSGKGQASYVVSQALTVSADGAYQYRPETEYPRIIDYAGRAQYREGPHSGTLLLQQRFNPDLLDDDAQPNWSSVNRWPEITYSYRGFTAGTLELGVGRFTQFPADVSSWRYALGFDRTRQTWNPFQGASVTHTVRADARQYSAGSSYLSLNQRLQWRQTLLANVTSTTVYTRRDVWGETPFAFDRWQEQQVLTSHISYFTPQLSLSLQGGYNFLTERYNTVVAHLRQRPTAALRWDVYAYYDLNRREMGNIAATAQYRPTETLDVQLGVRYSVSDGTWQRVDGKLSVPLGERWTLDLDTIYYPQQERFARGGVGVTWDLHCRELTLRYDHVRSEVWLEYTLNAFPTLPITFGTGETTSLFSLDDIQDILGVPDEAR